MSIDVLAELQVRRKFYIGLIGKQTNAAKALVRRQLGWRYDSDEGERTGVNKRADAIVSKAIAGKAQAAGDTDVADALAADLMVVAAAIGPLEKARHQVELDMKRLVRKLPISKAWAAGVHGLGELGLAVILAEAGDPANYANPGKLWKRLGLAPYNGQAYSTWRSSGGLSADEWTAGGYSPRRRAEMYAVVGDPLFRAQTVVMGPYRAVYDARRARTSETHPDWSKLHSHRDALRIMTKQLIVDLWSAWRRARDEMVSDGDLPAVECEGAIRELMPTGGVLPRPQPSPARGPA